MVELLFEDIFVLMRLDPDGKKFDKGFKLSFDRNFMNMLSLVA